MNNNYIKIYEIGNYNFENNVWLIEILKENKIPYETEIAEYWVGNRIREYRKRLDVFVPQEYKHEVEKYIAEYQSPNSIIKEDIPELKSIGDEENEREAKKVNKIKKGAVIIFFAFLIAIFIIAIRANFM